MNFRQCSKCGKKGLYYSNPKQVRASKQKGLGAWKVWKCKYCNRKERLWASQYQVGW